MQLKPLAILDSFEYFDNLLSLISQTKRGDRIALMSMSFEPEEPHIAKLMDGLTAAAERGVHVHFLIDALSFSFDKHDLPTGPVVFGKISAEAKRPYFRQKQQVLEKLRLKGGHYRIINRPSRRFVNPYAGRSHIKVAIINDTVFAGGCNLGTHQIDYMTRLNDASTATWMYEWVTQVAEYNSVRSALDDNDLTWVVDANTTIFVDAGKPKQSLIYEAALDFIDAAEKWLVMTCQFFPNTVTAAHLSAAVKRGVAVTLYYNHPRHHAPYMRPVHHAVIQTEKIRQARSLFIHQLPKDLRRLHAKVIASEQGAIIGSHNYVTHGVNFGTAEIALRRYDQNFSRDAVNALRRHLPQSYTDHLGYM